MLGGPSGRSPYASRMGRHSMHTRSGFMSPNLGMGNLCSEQVAQTMRPQWRQ